MHTIRACVLFLVALMAGLHLAEAAKPSKKSKSALGAPCFEDADCGLPELYCRILEGSTKEEKGKNSNGEAKPVATMHVGVDVPVQGICGLRLGLGHKCTSSSMCLSHYCGIDGDCEFSTRQMVVIVVVLGAFGVLMMAASAPPNYSELHADNGKGAKKVLWRKRSKLPIRQHVTAAGTGRRMNLYNHAHNTQHTHVHPTPSLASVRPHAPPSSAVDMLSDVTSALQRDLSASYTSGGGHRSMDMDMDAVGMCDTDGYEEEEDSSKTNLYSESEELEIVRATSNGSDDSDLSDAEKTELGGLRLGKSAAALVKPGHVTSAPASPMPRRSIIDRGLTLFDSNRRPDLVLSTIRQRSSTNSVSSDESDDNHNSDDDEEFTKPQLINTHQMAQPKQPIERKEDALPKPFSTSSLLSSTAEQTITEHTHTAKPRSHSVTAVEATDRGRANDTTRTSAYATNPLMHTEGGADAHTHTHTHTHTHAHVNMNNTRTPPLTTNSKAPYTRQLSLGQLHLSQQHKPASTLSTVEETASNGPGGGGGGSYKQTDRPKNGPSNELGPKASVGSKRGITDAGYKGNLPTEIDYASM